MPQRTVDAVESESSPTLPEQICGCPVDSELAPGKTYLAIGAGGRGVVLKKMDDDCLLRGLLHPSIRDRLSRVRELAHAGVANLHGVGREGDAAFLIWEYVEGEPFDAYASGRQRTPRELAVAARELVLAVDSLHMQGIVHGAINAGNAIVTPAGTVRLTNVSPLLFTETTADADAVAGLLEQTLERRGEQGTPLGQILASVHREQLSLRELGARLAAFIESRPFDDLLGSDPEPVDGPRRRNLVAAAVVAALGLALAYGAWMAAEAGHLSLPRSLHLPQFNSGK